MTKTARQLIAGRPDCAACQGTQQVWKFGWHNCQSCDGTGYADKMTTGEFLTIAYDKLLPLIQKDQDDRDEQLLDAANRGEVPFS